MASGRQELALVGYKEDLERRPLKFVEPVPASRICSACGNIPREMFMLMCGHAFCKMCYESCATTSDCVCPLDGDVCATTDITSKKYPAENLLRRMVHCWNEANGCGVVLPASQVAEHVRQDCQHHVTRCPTCSEPVLSHDMCAHLKSRCSALILHAAREVPPSPDDEENAHSLEFERNVEHRVRELDDMTAQLFLESNLQNNKLAELCHSLDNFKGAVAEQLEVLAEQIGPVSIRTLDRLDQNEAEVKALVIIVIIIITIIFFISCPT